MCLFVVNLLEFLFSICLVKLLYCLHADCLSVVLLAIFLSYAQDVVYD